MGSVHFKTIGGDKVMAVNASRPNKMTIVWRLECGLQALRERKGTFEHKVPRTFAVTISRGMFDK